MKPDDVERVAFYLDADSLKLLMDFSGAESEDKDDIAEVKLSVGEIYDEDTEKMDYGLRANLAEYPEEGCVMLYKMERPIAALQSPELDRAKDAMREAADVKYGFHPNHGKAQAAIKEYREARTALEKAD